MGEIRKIIQIAYGESTVAGRHHSIRYQGLRALDDHGIVWKWDSVNKKWIPLPDLPQLPLSELMKGWDKCTKDL